MTKKHAIILMVIYTLMFVIGLLVGEGITIKSQNEQLAILQNQYQDALTELGNKNNTIQEIETELEKIQNILQLEVENSIELSDELKQIVEEFEMVKATLSDLKDVEYELVYLGEYKITHYCVEEFKHICGNGDGLTATGTQVTVGVSIAVDPKVIPYGTEVYIPGYGWRKAEDCGSAIKGKRIDVAVNTHEEAEALGVVYRDIWILVKKSA